MPHLQHPLTSSVVFILSIIIILIASSSTHPPCKIVNVNHSHLFCYAHDPSTCKDQAQSQNLPPQAKAGILDIDATAQGDIIATTASPSN